MNIQTKTAAPTAIGNGGYISNAVTADKYRHENDNATLPFVRLDQIVEKIIGSIAAERRVCR